MQHVEHMRQVCQLWIQTDDPRIRGSEILCNFERYNSTQNLFFQHDQLTSVLNHATDIITQSSRKATFQTPSEENCRASNKSLINLMLVFQNRISYRSYISKLYLYLWQYSLAQKYPASLYTHAHKQTIISQTGTRRLNIVLTGFLMRPIQILQIKSQFQCISYYFWIIKVLGWHIYSHWNFLGPVGNSFFWSTNGNSSITEVIIIHT
jgi:hypothetical protein